MTKQRFEYDRVIYEIGAESFMTQRGIVVEGNFRIGDKVLLVFDMKSRRYLPSFKREKPPVAEEEERRIKQPSMVARAPVKSMLVAFVKDSTDYVVLIDILDSRTWTATPVLASSVDCDFGHVSFRTCQMPFQCITGLDVRRIFQFSGSFYLIGSPYLSNGFGTTVQSGGDDLLFSHGIWDEKNGKAFQSASYQGATIYPLSSIPHGPFRIFEDKIWICNQIEVEGEDLQPHYQLFRLSYDPDFGLTATFEKHIPYYVRVSSGYLPINAYRAGRPKPFYINESGEIFYKQVIFEEVVVVSVTVGVTINIYINNIHVSFTPTTVSKTAAAQGIAAAINAAFVNVVYAVAQDTFIKITTVNPEGIDVGIRYPDRTYLTFGDQDSISPLWSDQFRRRGWSLVILGAKEGDIISFSITGQRCDPNFSQVLIDAIGVFSYTIVKDETPQTVAQHLADSFNAQWWVDNHIVAANNGNVITFTAPAPTSYGHYYAGYPWLWSGEVLIVDYYPLTYLLKSYASKIKKIKDTSFGQVGDDIISDLFSFTAAGNIFVLHYNVPLDLYWDLDCVLDPIFSGSFDEVIDETVREELIYIDGSSRKLLFKTLDSKIQAHRSSSYNRTGTGIFDQVQEASRNLAFFDHLVEICQMEDIWNFENQWQVDGHFYYHVLAQNAGYDDDFDSTWYVDLKTREAKLVNFPFTSDPKKPFYYRNAGAPQNNCSVLINRHLVYHDSYPPQIHTEQITGNMGYQVGGSEIGTPYEKIFPIDGASFYGGWIHIEDGPKGILMQGIQLSKPGSRIIGNVALPILENIIYRNGRRIEEALAAALGTTSDKILGMIYVPGIENDPNWQKFTGG